MKTYLLLLAAASSIMLAACSSNPNGTSAESAAQTSADLDQTPAKLTKTANLTFKVSDVAKSSRTISGLAKRMDGMVMHHQLSSSVSKSNTLPLSTDSVLQISSCNTRADMLVRLPSEKVEEFVEQVAGMAVFVDSRNMDIEDKTLQYISNELKSNNEKDLVKQKQTLPRQNIKEARQLLAVKNQQADRQVSNMQTNMDVAYSTVALNFYQNNYISKEKIANTDLSVYQVPFFTKLTYAIAGGWSTFLATLIAIAHAWMFILLSLLAWFGWRSYYKAA